MGAYLGVRIRGSSWAWILATVLIAGATWSSAHAGQQSWKFAFASGSTGGTYNIVVAAVAERLKAAYPGTNVDILPGGSVSNIIQLGRGDFPIAMATTLIAKNAWEGKTPPEQFKGGMKTIRGVAAIYDQHFQFIARADLATEYIEDVIEKKMKLRYVPAPSPGHIEAQAMSDLLRTIYGISFRDMEAWGTKIIWAEYGDTTDMMRDGHVDLFTPLTAAPNGSVMDLVAQRPMKFLKMRESTRKKMVELGYVIADLPAKTYVKQDQAMPTVSAPAAFYARQDADEGLVYAITSTLLKNEEYMKKVHVRLKDDFHGKTAHQGLGVPLHPGAERAFKEMGYLK